MAKITRNKLSIDHRTRYFRLLTYINFSATEVKLELSFWVKSYLTERDRFLDHRSPWLNWDESNFHAVKIPEQQDDADDHIVASEPQIIQASHPRQIVESIFPLGSSNTNTLKRVEEAKQDENKFGGDGRGLEFFVSTLVIPDVAPAMRYSNQIVLPEDRFVESNRT